MCRVTPPLSSILDVITVWLLVLGAKEAAAVACKPGAELADLFAESIHRLVVHVGLSNELWQVDYVMLAKQQDMREISVVIPSILQRCSAPYASPGPLPSHSGYLPLSHKCRIWIISVSRNYSDVSQNSPQPTGPSQIDTAVSCRRSFRSRPSCQRRTPPAHQDRHYQVCDFPSPLHSSCR
jgi:hypothetical protein